MFSSLRTRFGIPGVISVIALVFAMFGGAYAATNSSGGGKATASAKAKKGPRGPKGATGPAGPAGPQGAAGANGKDGANGANGSNGAAGAVGKSVVTATVPPGANCEEGGTSVEVEGVPTSKKFVCNGLEGPAGNNGNEGSPWTAGGTLPPSSTETGGWIAKVDATGGTLTPISFAIPLATELDAAHTLIITSSSSAGDKEHCDDGAGTPSGPAHPEADPGYLCVFANPVAEAVPVFISRLDGPGTVIPGASTAGASIVLTGLENQAGFGTFAVTGAPAS